MIYEKKTLKKYLGKSIDEPLIRQSAKSSLPGLCLSTKGKGDCYRLNC